MLKLLSHKWTTAKNVLSFEQKKWKDSKFKKIILIDMKHLNDTNY